QQPSGILSGELLVPTNGVYLYLNFSTRWGVDSLAAMESMVHGTDGLPVRGARLPSCFVGGPGSDFEDITDKELECYPASYATYRTRWFLTSFRAKPDELIARVARELSDIGDEDTAEALWARAYGSLILRREREARDLILELLENYPASLAAFRAVSDYEYKCYEYGLDDGAAVICIQKQRAIAAHPTSLLAREEVRVVAREASFSLADTRRVCLPWIEEEPNQPEPKLVLARKYLAVDGDLAQAAAFASQALNGYLNGDSRLAGDTRGQMAQMMLPSAFMTAARIAQRRGDLALALAYSRAATAVALEADSSPWEFEAGLWEQLHNSDASMHAWRKALDAGSPQAEDALRQLGDAHSPEPVAVTGAANSNLAKAPGFSFKDLAEQPMSLEQYRGQVVVLNFWGLGCAPCKKEIPDLNALVDQFEGQAVAFLALSGDSPEDLRAYVEGHPFSYRIAGSAGQASAAYQVSGFPTHIVINRSGQISGTLVGGGPDQPKRLSVLIKRALEG
ncbi:MAG: peroxiredoxin, partial [Candidatus Paceibacteria bacterium]